MNVNRLVAYRLLLKWVAEVPLRSKTSDGTMS